MIAYPSTNSLRHSPEVIALGSLATILVFGAFALMGLYNLARPTQVVLNAEGFQIRGLRRLPVVRWKDADRFFLGRVKSSKFVCYDLKPDAKSSFQGATGMGRSSRWGDGQLPGALGMNPDEILRLFDDWHRRYRG